MNRFLAFIILMILCVGCSKKNTPVPVPTTASIVGTWYVTTDTLTTYVKGVAGSPYITNFNHSAYMTFKNDGTGSLYNGDHLSFTYTLSGKTAVINYAAQTGAYVAPPYTQTSDIKQLDANNLYMVIGSPSLTTNVDVESIRFAK